MNNNKKFYTVLIIASVLFGGYFIYTHSKKYYAKIIIMKGGSNGAYIDNLLTFDKQFLKEWAMALNNGQKTFVYSGNGREINSQGGSTVK